AKLQRSLHAGTSEERVTATSILENSRKFSQYSLKGRTRSQSRPCPQATGSLSRSSSFPDHCGERASPPLPGRTTHSTQDGRQSDRKSSPGHVASVSRAGEKHEAFTRSGNTTTP